MPTPDDNLTLSDEVVVYVLYLPSEYPSAVLVRLARTSHMSFLERLDACKADVNAAIKKKKKPVYRLR